MAPNNALARKSARDPLGFAVPLAEGGGVPLRETRDVGDGLFEVTPENEGGAIAMRLAEFVARRDVGYTFAEAEVLEPGRLANVEVIDGVQIVIEAGLGSLLGAKTTAVVQPALDNEDVESSLGEIRAEHEAVMTGSNDDPVVTPLEGVHVCSLVLCFCASVQEISKLEAGWEKYRGFCAKASQLVLAGRRQRRDVPIASDAVGARLSSLLRKPTSPSAWRAKRCARKPRPLPGGACCGFSSVAVLLAAAGPDQVEGLAVLDEVGVDRSGEARVVELDREIVAALVGALRPGGPNLDGPT
jgi:hypothetical protein